jgi:hypothetical protein
MKARTIAALILALALGAAASVATWQLQRDAAGHHHVATNSDDEDPGLIP